MASQSNARLPEEKALYHVPCSFGQLFASSFLQIWSRLQHPCSWLTIPVGWLVRDLHPKDIWYA